MRPDQPTPHPSILNPLPAASLVLIHETPLGLRVLMGRRHANLAFLAGKYVFPGGRVDTSDGACPIGEDLSDETIDLLLRRYEGATQREARALAIAALRETKEETGIVLSPMERPVLSALRFFARAITPPGRSRRFDTRFFMADAARVTIDPLIGDGELEALAWVDITAARKLDTAGVTRRVLDEAEASWFDHSRPVPFFQHVDGTATVSFL